MANRRLTYDDLLNVKSFAPGTRPALSPSGDFAAFALRDNRAWSEDTNIEWLDTGAPRQALASRVYAVSTSTGELLVPQGPPARSWDAHWAPADDTLLFLSDLGGEVGLWRWRPTEPDAVRLGSTVIAATSGGAVFEISRDSKWVYALARPEDWSPEGGASLLSAAPESSGGLTVEAFDSPAQEQGFSIYRSHAPDSLPNLVRVGIDAADVETLVSSLSADGIRLSPSGSWLAVDGLPRAVGPIREYKRVADLAAVSTKDGRAVELAVDLDYSGDGRRPPAWSITSDDLAYERDGELWIAGPDLPARRVASAEVRVDRVLGWDHVGILVVARPAESPSDRGLYQVAVSGTTDRLPTPAGEWWPLRTGGEDPSSGDDNAGARSDSQQGLIRQRDLVGAPVGSGAPPGPNRRASDIAGRCRPRRQVATGSGGHGLAAGSLHLATLR